MAFAEDRVLLSAVRAHEVRHVLHDAKNRHIHHLRHVDGFLHDQGHQILRRRDDDNPGHRDALEQRERDIAGPRRAVREEIVRLSPDRLGPELADRTGDDRSSPEDRIRIVFEQIVHRDYLDAGHYIVHSGGIVYKDGKNSNQPAGFGGADKLVSDTVELKDDKVIFEIVLPTNTYRVEKLPAYTKEDLHGVSLGGAMRVGSLGKTEIAETKYGLMHGIEPDDKLNEHNVSIIKQEDRLVFNGTFKRSSNVRVVLVKGFEQKYYKMRITDKVHAALCVAVFEEEENADADDITVTRFINSEGLDGKYDVYLEVYDKIYNLHQQVSF